MTTPSLENGTGNVTLYWMRFSPYAWRPYLALVEKGISFEAVPMILVPKQKEMWEINPVHGLIPVLRHDGNSICETTIILEYLEEAWPDQKPLMPTDPLGKYKVRFWTDFVNKGVDNIIEIVRAQIGRATRDSSVEKVPKFFEILEAAMMGYSADGPFFTGNQFGFLDVVLSPLYAWHKVLAGLVQSPLPGPDQLPRLNKWVKAMAEHKSVKDSVPTADENYEFYADKVKQYQERLHAEAPSQK